MHNRLPDPPHGIGDKLDTPRGIETFGCLDETDVALINEVGEGEAAADIFARYADDVAQITADELIEPFLIPGLRTRCQLHLFLAREQSDLLDFLEIGLQGIPSHRVTVAAILCHRLIPSWL